MLKINRLKTINSHFNNTTAMRVNGHSIAIKIGFAKNMPWL